MRRARGPGPGASRRASERWINEYKFAKGGCCKGKRVHCDTLEVFTHKFIVECRASVASQPKLVRQQHFIALSRAAKDVTNGRLEHFNLGGVSLCKNAFCELNNVSPKTLNSWAESTSAYDSGYTPRDTPVTGPAMSWLSRRLHELSDTCPTSRNLILPQETINSKDLRRMYLYESQLLEGMAAYISNSSWYLLMKVLHTRNFFI
jgi:hypothetical protein